MKLEVGGLETAAWRLDSGLLAVGWRLAAGGWSLEPVSLEPGGRGLEAGGGGWRLEAGGLEAGGWRLEARS